MSNVRLAACVVLFCSFPLFAQYEEAFDDANADVKINQQDEFDSTVMFVDYGNMTIGITDFNIPEAPRPVAGGQPTRGILMQANLAFGAPVGTNILAGQTPINFTGDYTLSFDAFLSISSVPFPTSGSTEQLLWGVGNDDDGDIEARNTRAGLVDGTWGWLATENGYSTEDAAIFEQGAELADLGDTQTGEDLPFNDAFTTPAAPDAINNAPANEWVEVDVVVSSGSVSVNFNGVEFFNEESFSTDGFAMLGYEDPFGSVNGYDPPAGEPDFPVEDYTWGLFDNFRVTANTGVDGDFNDDGEFDCSDVDPLVAEIAAGTNSGEFDLNGDGSVDGSDLTAWLAEAGALSTVTGGNAFQGADSNLDGVVDVSDFNTWNGSKFTATSAFCSGDFNADGFVDVSDFNIWNGQKFTSSSDAAVVPEPTGLVVILAGMMLLFSPLRKRMVG